MQRKVPSAITNITLNRATFTDVSIDELTFVNFFYGNNGAGKSSIAHAIDEDDVLSGPMARPPRTLTYLSIIRISSMIIL